MQRRKEKAEIAIKSFDITKMRPNSKAVMIGPPGTGKSSLIDNIIYFLSHHFATAKIFSGTENENNFYEGGNPRKPKIPAYYIWDELIEDEIIKFMQRQKLVLSEAKKGASINEWSMLICDDVSDDTKILNKRIFKTLLKLGRHWKCLFLFAMQYPCDLHPNLRSSFDYVFIMQTNDDKTLEILHKNFGSIIQNFYDFKDIMKQVAKNYGALVIDRTNRESNKIEDKVFYYQPVYPIPRFEFGCDEYRAKAAKEYNYEYDVGDELLKGKELVYKRK